MSSKTEHLWIKVLYYSVMTGLGALILIALYHLLGLLLGGFFLAFLARPMVDKLERRGYSRVLSASVFFVILFTVFAISILLIVPSLEHQYQEFTSNQDQYIEQIQYQINQCRNWALTFVSQDKVNHYEPIITNKLNELSHDSQQLLLIIIQVFLKKLGTLIFIPVVAFFFLIQGSEIFKNIIKFVPNRYFEMSLMMVHHVNQAISGYLRGQFFNCLYIGGLASIGLSIIQVPGAIAIGLFAGLANAIPYLGPLVGALPAIVLLLIDPSASSPWWHVLVVFGIVNLLDNVLVYPMTVGKSLQLHPLVAILGILFGGAFGGVLGMIIAVPMISIFSKIFKVFHTTLRFYRII